MENIRIETDLRYVQGVPILDVNGEIDIYTNPQFKEAVGDAIDKGVPNIVINMRKVSYMDSSGFGTLLSGTKRLRPFSGSLNLCCCSEPIRRMLQITRLDTIFGVFETEDEAVRQALTLEDAALNESAEEAVVV